MSRSKKRLDGPIARQNSNYAGQSFPGHRVGHTKRKVLKIKCGIGHFRLKAQRYAVSLKAKGQQLHA